MKNTNPRFPAIFRRRILNQSFNPWLASSIALLLVSPSLRAASFTWDASGANPTDPTDGGGIWNTALATKWSDGATDTDWVNDENYAVFGNNNGPAGTVTLATGITVGGITFNSAGSGNYTVAGAGNILTFGGASNTVLVAANANATISAPLAMSGSVTILRKAGFGIIGLSGGGTVTRIEAGPSNGSVFVTNGMFALGALNFYDTGRGNDNTTNGKVFQTGGDVTTSENWDGRNNSSSYNITGGSLTATPPNRIRGLGTFNASGNAVVNFTTDDPRIASDGSSGTLSINGNASFTHSGSYAQLNLVNSGNVVSGTINLGGGTLTVLGIRNGSTTGNGFVNFNGGTLKVNPLVLFAGSFLEASPLITASVYGGGVIVDSNGKNVTISQPLLATTGKGVDTVTVADGGSDYTTAPSVTFSDGGGTGATGYALIDLSGAVTSVVITNPGRDYTSPPTVTFGSGFATATATAALDNAKGGLTKTGTGTLTLTGSNTYTGTTTIQGGTLRFTQPGLLDSSTVKIEADGLLQLDFNGTDNVTALIIDNVSMGDGLYDNGTPGIFGNGKLRVGIVANVYASWEEANGISGAGAAVDSDNDGVSNGIEFVIGGDPSGPDSDSNSLLQPVTVDASNLTYIFRRTTDSASYQPFVEYSSDLTAWTKAENGVNSVTIAENLGFYGAGIDKVTVVIPRSLAGGSKFFARLKVNIP